MPTLTTRTVLGIVSYAKWPISPDYYRLCIVGDATNLTPLTEHPQQVSGHELRVSFPTITNENWVSACDIVYLGAMTRTQRLSILNKIKPTTILTIGEGDEMCEDGMMFCLRSVGQNASLQTNLDAIARSGIKINANVLLLLRQRAIQP